MSKIITITPVADKGNNRDYTVVVNGKRYEVERGESTTVPLAVANVLVDSAGAMEDKFVIGSEDPSSPGGGGVS